MIRYSEDYIIVLQDLEDGFVKKHNYKTVVEYWVYKAKKSNVFLPNGTMAKSVTEEPEFIAIIVCENHHTIKRDNNILIAGYKFTENDLEDYLKKTGR